MAQSRYQIFQLSAQAVMSYAVEVNGTYSFDLSASATEKRRSRTATHEQDSNALLFQIMCVLRGDGYTKPNDGTLIHDLSDAIFYMDFDRVFDRSTASKSSGSTRRRPGPWILAPSPTAMWLLSAPAA